MIILDLKIEANTGQTNHINEFNKCKKIIITLLLLLNQNKLSKSKQRSQKNLRLNLKKSEAKIFKINFIFETGLFIREKTRLLIRTLILVVSSG